MKSNNNRRSFLKKMTMSGIGVSLMPLSYALQDPTAVGSMDNLLMSTGADKEEISCWLESSLNRIFPQTPSKKSPKFKLLGARNSRISFQVGFRNNTSKMQIINCSLEGTGMMKSMIRTVGLVPMPSFTPITNIEELDGVGQYPGLAPDPLFPTSEIGASPFTTRSFWITLNIPAEMQPSNYKLKIILSSESTYKNNTLRVLKDSKKEIFELPLELDVAKMVVKPRENFHVTHWVRGEATWNYYKTEMFDEKWWQLSKAQLLDLLDHGTDVVYVPVLFFLKPIFKRPCQLLIVDEPSPGKYVFDWTLVERFIKMCKEIGYTKFEWTTLWVYWGVEHPTRVYKKVNGKHELLWDPNISAFSEIYLNFLRQFLPQFHSFLLKQDVLKGSYFHLSDEPDARHIANYRQAKQVLNELAPWMHPLMDALSNIKYGREKLVDIPIPKVDAASEFIAEKIPHWVYYCQTPQGSFLNRFFDTPLAKIRMAGFLFYHLKAEGFLHWGYNYWNKLETEEVLDPFCHADAGVYPEIPFGDPFVVYPGPDGPISSIRWEVFAEALQDFAILQTAGISKDDKRFAELKSYADFPKSEKWIKNTMYNILKS